MDKDVPQKSPETDQERSPGFLAIVLSTIAAAFGVQSSRNYQRDFKSGNLWVYVSAGVIFTALFVLIVASVVTTVIANQ